MTAGTADAPGLGPRVRPERTACGWIPSLNRCPSPTTSKTNNETGQDGCHRLRPQRANGGRGRLSWACVMVRPGLAAGKTNLAWARGRCDDGR